MSDETKDLIIAMAGVASALIALVGMITTIWISKGQLPKVHTLVEEQCDEIKELKIRIDQLKKEKWNRDKLDRAGQWRKDHDE